MGKDIYNFVELRDKEGKWHIAPVMVKHQYVDDNEKEWGYAQPYSGRDYELFDILSGGKNYSCIDYPRGLPIDVSDEVRAEREKFIDKDEVSDEPRDFAFDDTYFTLFELRLALDNKKKYPKWHKWTDCDGNVQKEAGPRDRLRYFVDSIDMLASMCGYYNDVDVRVVLWFDW